MRDTTIIWPLRLLFLVELFFAVSASISVAWRPALTAENFAWTIKPAVMAAMFGGFYLALLPVAVLLVLARRWETVRVFVLRGMLFTFAQLVVTFLHWDRFAVGSAPFNIWFASYLIPPPVYLFCYWWQQRRTVSPESGAPLSRWQIMTLLTLGVLFTAESLLGLLYPTWFSASAPWKISPLNARALSGYFLLIGLTLLSMARENDRDRVRIVTPFLIALLPIVAFQISRFSSEVDWTHPRIYLTFFLLFVVMMVGTSLFRGDWRKSLGWRRSPSG